MVEVMPNYEREVDVKDVPPTLSLILTWPHGDNKPLITRVVSRVLFLD